MSNAPQNSPTPIPTLPQPTWQSITDTILRAATPILLAYLGFSGGLPAPQPPVPSPEEVWRTETAAKLDKIQKLLEDLHKSIELDPQ